MVGIDVYGYIDACVYYCISSSHRSTPPPPNNHKDPSLLLLNGELVAAWHLDGLVEEAGVALQDKGKVRSVSRCSLV